MNPDQFTQELSAQISAKIHSNPDHAQRIKAFLENYYSKHNETLWSLCSKAAIIFDHVELLVDDHNINWFLSHERYADHILDFLLTRQVPKPKDFIAMAVNSIE